jgi:hypothetical protein
LYESNSRQVNWLKDFLPKKIPYARILSYGYNSSVQFSKSAAGISTFAEQLLEDILLAIRHLVASFYAQERQNSEEIVTHFSILSRISLAAA